jgi:hypothetical protein
MEITRRTIAERGNGPAFQAIAAVLLADGVPTARSLTRWYAVITKGRDGQRQRRGTGVARGSVPGIG